MAHITKGSPSRLSSLSGHHKGDWSAFGVKISVAKEFLEAFGLNIESFAAGFITVVT